MARETFYTCDGCDTRMKSDELPKGWSKIKIKVEGFTTPEGVHLGPCAGENELCQRCQKAIVGFLDPKAWPRRSPAERAA